MSSPAAILDSNPTRAQLRLVVLGQWVQAGLALARGATARGGLVGGAVALWQVFQAVRLAMALVQRLSDLRDALSRAAPAAAPGACPDAPSNDRPSNADALRGALSEIAGTIHAALGLDPNRRRQSGAAEAAGCPAVPTARARPRPFGRLQPPLGWPPGSLRRRRRSAPAALQTTLTPIVA